MKNSCFLIIAFSMLLTACNISPHPDYSRLKGDLYFRLIEIGEGNARISPGEIVSVDINYKTMEDSVFFRAHRRFILEESPYPGSVNDGFMALTEGDSASFILQTDNFFKYTLKREVPPFLKYEEKLKVNVRIKEVQTAEEYEKEKEMFLLWAKEFRMSEMDLIRDYLEKNKLEAEAESNGIYFLSREIGSGSEVKRGKHIWIHYEGKFLNGKFVDSSKKRQEPLDFVYGKDMYLIEGLDYAIGQMREGGKAVVLIPSELGFGASGSVAGIVPPFTAMIYLVEILKVE
jgi:FKBP-type peptidyl-prolyl cis-trans isomerase